MRQVRTLLLALAAILLLPMAAAQAQLDQQQLISQAQSTLERMAVDSNYQQHFRADLQAAKAVIIVPSFYKAGFFLGGEYGTGIVLSHNADGTWSYPGFLTLGGGSFGLQIGAASSSVIFMIRSDSALRAVLNNQFKFGADAGVTFAVVGAGIGGDTTSHGGADILAYSLSGVGLYGGLTLNGAVLSPKESWNAAYYGQSLSNRAIVLEQSASNRGADPLRDALAR